MNNSVPCLTVFWEWNPNHRYRFYATRPLGNWARLFTIRFSKKDQSVYLSPRLVGAEDGVDFHLSIHESGIVNITQDGSSERIKRHKQDPSPVRHVATFQLNQLEFFEQSTEDEFNNTKGGHIHLPILGSHFAPRMLTIYCVENGQDWKLPLLGNSPMLHYKSQMKGKNYNFEFVVWQDINMPFGEGAMTFQFGGNNDEFYGV